MSLLYLFLGCVGGLVREPPSNLDLLLVSRWFFFWISAMVNYHFWKPPFGVFVFFSKHPKSKSKDPPKKKNLRAKIVQKMLGLKWRSCHFPMLPVHKSQPVTPKTSRQHDFLLQNWNDGIGRTCFFQIGWYKKPATTVTVTFGFSAANSQIGRVSWPGRKFVVVVYAFVLNHQNVYPEGPKTIV